MAEGSSRRSKGWRRVKGWKGWDGEDGRVEEDEAEEAGGMGRGRRDGRRVCGGREKRRALRVRREEEKRGNGGMDWDWGCCRRALEAARGWARRMGGCRFWLLLSVAKLLLWCCLYHSRQ